MTDRSDTEIAEEGPASHDELTMLRVAWSVTPDRFGEWSLHLAQIGVDGHEEHLAELPLDPDLTVEMVDALVLAHEDMTGENLLLTEGGPAGQPDVPFWPPRHWAEHPRFRTVVITAAITMALTLLIVNLL